VPRKSGNFLLKSCRFLLKYCTFHPILNLNRHFEMKNITTLLFCLFFFTLIAQPKREFRAVWIAHVSNIDWPSSKTLIAQRQRDEFIEQLDQHKLSNINAVVVQVRPSCDAIYPISIEPWAEWLTGKQGQSPGYDPLQFMIDETHKKGMEFHAWFNPYRAVINTVSSSVDTGHVSIKHPEWCITFGTLKFLNPGLPEVRNYVTSVIMDVVRRYDIDAVHFDDYFYPYPQPGLTIADDNTFAQNGRGIANKDNWRRDNVDLLVKMVSDSIRNAKKYVKFGISPFGIWRNSASDVQGSITNGLESYSAIYGDSRKWIQQGWLDYIAPQLYWSIGFTPAPYDALLPWWSSVSTNRHLYIGQSTYRINTSTDPNWLKASEMPNQLRLNRSTPSVSGSIHFSSTQVLKNTLGFQDSLRANFYNRPSLIPTMRWKDSIPPLAPTGLTATLNANQTKVTLKWNRPNAAPDGDKAHYFVVYRFLFGETLDLTKTVAIRQITVNDSTSFTDVYANPSGFQYVVTAVDRLHNESVISNIVQVGVTKTIENQAFTSRLLPNYPNPFSETTTIRYELKKGGLVNIQIFNISGAQVANLIQQQQIEGIYETEWRAEGLPNGVYICTLTVDGGAAVSQRLILSK
jgi:uncharacterized lipoprotein YddW (UPF0748 family)